MYEKVNPHHPDKIADSIAGAIVDLAYIKEKDPRIAVEVLLGHGVCNVMVESSVIIPKEEVDAAVSRIAGPMHLQYVYALQDEHLARNQESGFRCGDNGIFKGAPVTEEQIRLVDTAGVIELLCPYDGKYILDGDKLVICQSNSDMSKIPLEKLFPNAIINPLGDWTGGTDVDCGATNRKLGSDMGDSITGGGLHGKDLSKADVSVNIYAWLKAQQTGKTVELSCAIGDDMVDGKPYSEIVEVARSYIMGIGGFERFAEWGLIR